MRYKNQLTPQIAELFYYNAVIYPMNDIVCNLCSRKLSSHTYQESLECAMKLIKDGRKKIGMSQHKLRQSMS